MTYATPQNMIDRFGETEVIALTDRSGIGLVDVDVLAVALAVADDEINPYLAPRYQLPLVTVPKIISGYACDITRYRLCGAVVNMTDDISDRYKHALRFFEHVARGTIGLGLDAANSTAPSANTVKFSEPTGRVFSRDRRG
jgi:phage gp36-like protein